MTVDGDNATILSSGEESQSEHGDKNIGKPSVRVEQANKETGVEAEIRVKSSSGQVLKRLRAKAVTSRPPNLPRVVLEPYAQLQKVCNQYDLLFEVIHFLTCIICRKLAPLWP